MEHSPLNLLNILGKIHKYSSIFLDSLTKRIFGMFDLQIPNFNLNIIMCVETKFLCFVNENFKILTI